MNCPHKVKLEGKFDIFHRQLYRPCGACAVCRRNKIINLTNRAKYEFQHSKYNAFLTLTYDDNNLRYNEGASLPTVHKKDVSDFISSIRHWLKYNKLDNSFTYLACSEYGGKTERPHYHLAIFGLDFPLVKTLATMFWKYGFNDVKPLESGAIRYVIKYLSKQTNGNLRDFQFYDKGLEAPKVFWSKGFGSKLFSDNKQEINDNGYISLGSKKVSVPSYYRDKFSDYDFQKIRMNHKNMLKSHYDKKSYAKMLGFNSVDDLNNYFSKVFEKNKLYSDINHKQSINLEDLI